MLCLQVLDEEQERLVDFSVVIENAFLVNGNRSGEYTAYACCILYR